MFKVHLPHGQAMLQSHSPSQVALTNQLFQSWGGSTSAGRSANFDSFSEIGYRSPQVFRIISEDQSAQIMSRLGSFTNTQTCFISINKMQFCKHYVPYNYERHIYIGDYINMD